jgi:hypothetical protein
VSKKTKKNRTSFMDVPLAMWQKFVHMYSFYKFAYKIIK